MGTIAPLIFAALHAAAFLVLRRLRYFMLDTTVEPIYYNYYSASVSKSVQEETIARGQTRKQGRKAPQAIKLTKKIQPSKVIDRLGFIQQGDDGHQRGVV